MVGRHDGAVARRALLRGNAEKLCSHLYEGDAPSGARPAEYGKGLPDRPAAAGDHRTPLGVGVDRVEPHLVPVGLEFICENTGERGSHVLPHFSADDVHGDDAVVIDAVPDGRLEHVLRIRGVRQRLSPREAEGDRGARHAHQKAAARRRNDRRNSIVTAALEPSHWSRLSQAR